MGIFKRSEKSTKKIKLTLYGSIAIIIVLFIVNIILGIVAIIALGTSIAIDIRSLKMNPIVYKFMSFMIWHITRILIRNKLVQDNSFIWIYLPIFIRITIFP